ncbi:MAG TPA: transporter substrate-binding domain-containing protein [Candidatus Paceibacterota bacterium]|nr:transporter substrate-binding domain-containing protein [Candidatus Paceibacterota bacterium]
MKKVFIYFLGLVSLFFCFNFSLAQTATKVVKVGAFNNYPVIFKNTSGSIEGLYVDLLEEIGKRENIKFDYVFGTWNDGLERIKSGEVDLLTSVAYTEDRALIMEYTKNPLMTVWGDVYAPKNSDISGILELSGKKIGVLIGDINYKNFQDLLSRFGLESEFVEFSSYDDVFAAVADGEVDVGVAGITFGATNESKYGLKSTGIVFGPLNLYFTTAKDKNPELILTLDKYLSSWKKQDNSFLDQTKQKWFYGGLGTVIVLPDWIKQSLFALLILLSISFAFVFLLRKQVRAATEKIRAQTKDLEESELKYRSIYNNFMDVYYRADMNGIIIEASPSCADVTGWSQTDLVGRPVFDISFNPEDQIVFRDKLLRDGYVNDYEIKLLKRGGSPFVGSISSHMVQDEKGNPKYIEGVVRDITQRKKIEEELRRSVEELEKMNKFMVGREVKMTEMKKEIDELRARMGK